MVSFIGATASQSVLALGFLAASLWILTVTALRSKPCLLSMGSNPKLWCSSTTSASSACTKPTS